MRLIAKVRRNQCYIDCARLLDDLGLPYELHRPTGKGHPFLLVENPNNPSEPIKHHVACTPRKYKSRSVSLMMLRRKLTEGGIKLD
ncbi:hypothetical protein ACTZWY_11975 [Roseinatronobacter sp. NSM]